MRNKKLLLSIGIFLLLLLFMVSAGIMGDIYLGSPQKEDTGPLSTVDNTQVSYIGKNTPVVQEIYYRKCKHLIRETVIGDSKFAEKSFGELRGEGWNVSWSEDGKIIAFKEADELCPEDAAKRHLGVYEDELAIYAGPTGSDGELLEPLGIKLTDLYPKWQEILKTEGIDFNNEEELLNALESLDEF